MESALGDMNSRATKPIPAVPTTSSSAWGPLLRGHMDQILPVIDKWRNSLDTLLVFRFRTEQQRPIRLQVALFSAVITTFIAQSLSGLSEDPADTTNQHLANITKILLSIHSVDIAKMGGLNLTQAAQFKPEPHVVRTNFYWSLALISSISVACLTVMTRGSLAKILRSTHTETYQKLAEFHSRWNQVDKFLGPTIETLLQLLVVPVVLFLIGLLDTLMSASLPLLQSSILIFMAGIIACICFFGVATFAVYIITRGSFDDSDAFLNSWFLSWLPICKNTTEPEPSNVTDQPKLQADFAKRHSFLKRVVSWFPLKFRGSEISTQALDLEAGSSNIPRIPLLSRWKLCSNSRGNNIVGSNSIPHVPEGVGQHPLLAARYQETFHAVICTIHDDEALDQAIAILPSLIQERRLGVGPGRDLNATPHEVKTLLHLLSMDVSIRCNVAAADIILDSISPDRLNKLPGEISHMTNTILSLVVSLVRKARLPHQDGHEEFEILCVDAPALALLVIPFSNIRQFEDPADLERLRLEAVNHAYDCLVFKMEEMEDYLQTRNKAFLSVVEEINVDLTTTLLQIGNAHSYMPFLLDLLPVKLGTGINDDLGPNYECFLAVLGLMFTPTVSQLSLKFMVDSIRAVIIYHKDHFRGTPQESLDLFLVTEKLLHILNGSLIDFYHSEGVGWEDLFQTCVALVLFMFDTNLHGSFQNMPGLRTQGTYSSVPRLLHGVIIEILNHIRRAGDESRPPADFGRENVLLSDETKAFLLSIEPRAGYYNLTEKNDLLNAFRSLDPSLPPWPYVI
ncbi:hypothetical protein C0993_008174 [Termitomyces sp. T159_Od127]|nr:hypothetical protein C0993_008174 [Termitomyces sp. T159_Od127]